MTDNSDWLVLSGGFVREPEDGNLDEVTSLPGPATFLRALFLELTGVDIPPLARETHSSSSEEDGVATGKATFGTDDAGYVQSEMSSTESSMFPAYASIKTHGLPGLEMSWSYELSYQGQLGHSGFRHSSLRVRFENPEAREQFEKVWAGIFGCVPEFKPSSA